VFRTAIQGPISVGQHANLYLRPETMRILPTEKEALNCFNVVVKAILFDGANSRLLTVTPGGQELLVALPQNRSFDHIKPGQAIEVGWHPDAAVCFKAEA
jgi:spermidine/putrescine transport system ATP-binding protein